MKKKMIAMLALGLLVLAGCSAMESAPTETPAPPTRTPAPTSSPPPPTNTPVPEVTLGDAERGRVIFENGGVREGWQGHHCSRCHTLDGSDEKEHLAPPLQGISESAGERVPGLSAAQYIHQSIMDPKAYIVDGYPYMRLTPRRLLTEEEVADLVAFLLTQ